MLQLQHRLSKDIDIFFHDAQYLTFLSPRVGGEEIWGADAYDEAAHYVKLIYAEGEIDFIISSNITNILPHRMSVEGDINAGIAAYVIPIEHPVEIALKKLWHRGPELKIRDVFDIAVVAEHHEALLVANLHHVKSKKNAIVSRLSNIDGNFFRASMEELDILPAYASTAKSALATVRTILDRI